MSLRQGSDRTRPIAALAASGFAAMLAALVSGGVGGTWTFSLLAAAVPAGLVAAALPRGARGAIVIPLGLGMGLSMATIALLCGQVEHPAIVAFGLPANALVLFGGLILVPLVLIAGAHALGPRAEGRER